MTPDSVPELSVVVLCYRAGDYVRDFVDRLEPLLRQTVGEAYEIVLVGNYQPGTDDPTPDVVRDVAAGREHVRCLTLAKEGMMGWDMRSGLEETRGRTITVIDGDGQMPIEDIPRVYRTLVDRDLDLVKTYRRKRGDGFRRVVLSDVFNTLFRILFPGLGSRDVNSKPKIFTREAYRRFRLTADDWFVDAEIMLEVRRLELRFEEIPTDFLGLVGRRSFISLGAVAEFLRNLARARWREFRRP